MSNLSDLNQATWALSDQTTSSYDLLVIARNHPSLRQLVAGHPNADQGLLDWLDSLGDPHVSRIISQLAQSSSMTASGSEVWPVMADISSGEQRVHTEDIQGSLRYPGSSPSGSKSSPWLEIWLSIVLIVVIVAGISIISNGLELNTPTTGAGDDTLGDGCCGAWDMNGDGLLKVGFAQSGSESAWRVANNEDVQEYFVESNGFQLLFADANGDDALQKQQVLDFIFQGAEIIVIAPIVSDGWLPVLQETQSAGIPVINFDRHLEGVDQYFLFYFGSSMFFEGERAVMWLENYIVDNDLRDEDIRIIHLQGTMGSDEQVGRSQGLRDGIELNEWKIVTAETGKFDYEESRRVMGRILNSIKPNDFNVVWGESDYMIYGAIDAMKAKGLDPRKYIIVSFGGNRTAVQLVIDGQINAISEYSPRIAAQLGEFIVEASNCKGMPPEIYVSEGIIDSSNANEKLLPAYGI